jgi:hypothetical protein
MVWAASLRGTVTEVHHGGKKKDFIEVRERKKRRLFQAWWRSAGGVSPQITLSLNPWDFEFNTT